MAQATPKSFPRYADEPPVFLLWSVDEAIPVGLGLALGILMEQLIVMTVLGLVASNFYKKYRDRHPDGYLLHAAYWWGLVKGQGPSLVNPFQKRWLP